jgi:putative ABC transport system ATP-binding protein
MSILLELRCVRKDVPGLSILRGVDLELSPGESLAVGGPSGSGKSTLLGVMAGLDKPTAGAVIYKGTDLGHLTDDQLSAWRRKSAGFVFQSFRLVPTMTAVENAALPLELLGRSPREALTEAAFALSALGLDQALHRFPDQLSGGEQQRVAIARALIHGPEIVFADEPTGALDRETGAKVLDTLFEACKKRGAALVAVSHDPAVAARAGRSTVLIQGKLA